MVQVNESRELRANIGELVTTPSQITFKVISWTSAKEHGLDTEQTAHGSRLVIERNGKEETYFSNPSGIAGAKRLKALYEECGLAVSGKSSTEKERHYKVANLELATDAELEELREQINTLLTEREKARKRQEKRDLLESLLADEEKLAKILASL